jgi:hypothetical protein
LGKEGSKSSKKVKTTQLVKREKGSKGFASSNDIKMMPPPVASVAKALEPSRAPSGRRAPVSPSSLKGKEVQAQEHPLTIFESKSRAIKCAREACEAVDLEVYDDVNNKNLLRMCVHDMMKVSFVFIYLSCLSIDCFVSIFPVCTFQAVGQVLIVGLRLSSFELEVEKAKTELVDALARNVAHVKTIAGLKTERDDLRGQVKKLKTEVVEKDNLLMSSEESCKAFSDQIESLREEMKNIGQVAVSEFKSSDEF